MTQLGQTIMREVATLPEDRMANVLAYIRFLKFGLDAGQDEIEKRFEKSWKQVRERTKGLEITQKDIETEYCTPKESIHNM